MDRVTLNQLLQSFNSLTKEEQESAIHMMKLCGEDKQSKQSIAV